MEIPPEITLPNIEKACILFFKDLRFDPSAPPHFYITIPLEPGKIFVLCIITSQIEKRRNYYSKGNPEALNSLIIIEKGYFNFLRKDSLIDCNQTEILTRRQFLERIDMEFGLEIKLNYLPFNLGKEILNAIVKSPLISQKVKDMISKISWDKIFNK